MSDTTTSPDYCVHGFGAQLRRLGLATLAFAVAAGYLFLIASAGVFDELVVGVFVPLTLAYEWVAETKVGLCVLLTREPSRAVSQAAASRKGADPPAARHFEDYGNDPVSDTRITVVSVVAATLTTALVFLGWTLIR